MTEWKRIDKAAPPAGSVLLSDTEGAMMIGFWNGTAWDDGDFNSFEDWPTHYMPLPAPPEATNDR